MQLRVSVCAPILCLRNAATASAQSLCGARVVAVNVQQGETNNKGLITWYGCGIERTLSPNSDTSLNPEPGRSSSRPDKPRGKDNSGGDWSGGLDALSKLSQSLRPHSEAPRAHMWAAYCRTRFTSIKGAIRNSCRTMKSR